MTTARLPTRAVYQRSEAWTTGQMARCHAAPEFQSCTFGRRRRHCRNLGCRRILVSTEQSIGPEPPADGAAGRAADSAQVQLLLHGSVENLLGTWNQEAVRFPGVSRLEGARIVNQYEHPVAVRYTLNSLLGLIEAGRCGRLAVTEPEALAMARAFVSRASERVTLSGDRGMFLMLLCALETPASQLRARTRELRTVLRDGLPTLTVQDVAWLLWGAAEAARAGIAQAEDVVREAYAILTGRLLNGSSSLPRHSGRWYRRRIVSFGAIAYYLRAVHEAAVTLDDPGAADLFARGVARLIELQGPMGEWPWMIDCRTARPFDFYPVFAVHQDSMAMLFLHPALDRGLPGAERAIERSLAWDFGNNELGIKMFVEQPFFAYRSIERAERAPRARRYGRSLVARAESRPARPDARMPRLNSECRSYHLGWILYSWSNRREMVTSGAG